MSYIQHCKQNNNLINNFPGDIFQVIIFSILLFQLFAPLIFAHLNPGHFRAPLIFVHL